MMAILCQEIKWTTLVHPVDPEGYSLQQAIAH
jgi:hypothetical protein